MYKYLFLSLLLVACAEDRREILQDAGSDGPPIVLVDTACHPAQLQTSFTNCGVCGESCQPANADRCERGVCMCGVGESCGEGKDCRFGTCFESDPEGKICEFDEECSEGSACLEGHCSFVRCVQEVCDGVDNDCDGSIDNETSRPLSRWCAGNTTLNSPSDIRSPCRAGTQVCTAGVWSECMGDIPPIPEAGLFACNGIDDNCDGCIDSDGEPGMCSPRVEQIFDVVFAVDTSGSMSNEIEAVKQTVRQFASSLDPTILAATQFALVRVPGVGSLSDVHQDLTDLPGLVFALETIRARFSGTGSEPSWDAIYELAIGELPISWREGSTRIIIEFTDEEGHTYRFWDPAPEAVVCEALDHGEFWVTFTLPQYFEDFDDCGIVFELTEDAAVMQSYLNSVIGDPCE